MERGYIKLWRKTLDSGLLQHPTGLQVFMYLLLKTAAKPYKRIVAGQSVEVPVGAVLTSRSTLSADLGITEKQARTALALLEKLEIVTIKRASKYSMVFFVNWHRYQQQHPADGPAESPADGPSKGQVRATLKEYKNNLITPDIPNGISAPSGGTPTVRRKSSSSIFKPPTLEEVEAYCRERGNTVDARKWWDFYQSKGWVVGRAKMRDWKAAVRTWEQEGRKATPTSAPQRMSKAEEFQAQNRAVCQRVYEMFTGQTEQGVFDV